MLPRVLTAPGEDFALEPQLRQILCYLDDERLLISKSHTFSPHVRGFVARLQRMGRSPQETYVDLAVIAEHYAGAAKQDGRQVSASQMQREAVELFARGVAMRASDIHVRVSKRDRTRIYFRVHNDLEFVQEHTLEYGEQLCTTIYQAMADVSDPTFETLSRQDARISDRAKLGPGLDGIRVATSPQVDGFIMVLRLLYNDAANTVDLEALGYSENHRHAFEFLKKRPSGINIIGGPTGSGKSTTLQRVLTGLIRECDMRKHVITVEDPPEYPIPGAVQTPVTNAESEEERSRAFQAAIKAAMRLDPDVIMIGEVRDAPSARLAVQAAMTGHQVWTTVHANNAFGILDRLTDLGVPMELVCDPTIVSGLACQRLVKVLCPHCKQSLMEARGRYRPEDLNRIMGVAKVQNVYVRGEGCEHCRGSGTIGRTVLSETVVMDEMLATHLRKRDRVAAIEYWRRDQQGQTMVEHAIEKVNAGLVDPFQAEDSVGLINAAVIERDFRISAVEVKSAVAGA